MDNSKAEETLQSDVVSIQNIPIIKTLLDVICSVTGMGFAAVARVTEDRWITCSAVDKINFGLKPGDELKIETTICHEVRQTEERVVIDDVDKDQRFCNHHIPAMYGFKSYISVPIMRKDSSFFGTLCAIDPKPKKLNTPEVIGLFNLFSDLISFHLQAIAQIESSEGKLLKEREERTRVLEQKNAELQKMNLELDSFAYVASHDLQEPLRKIETFAGLILEREYDVLSDTAKRHFDRLRKSVVRMQTLIEDLLTYTSVKVHDKIFKKTALNNIVEEVKDSYAEEISQKSAKIEVGEMCTASVIPFQFYQLLHNLIGNSIKFSKPGVSPVIQITSTIEKGDPHLSDKLFPEKYYCHITVTDNGIGFDPQYNEKIFKVFHRLNGREEYEGTGIGLSIVKKIVDNHKGFIIATGEINKGARFDIYIPQEFETSPASAN